MYNLVYCFLFVFLSLSAYSHHIVGGDVTISLIDEHTHQYKIILTFLFDEVNGSPDSEDLLEVVTVFNKVNNQPIESFILQKTSNNAYLPYTSSACSSAELKTRIIIYEANVSFPPSTYNQPAGYYLAWERCCRSEDLSNIVNPDQSGVVFYAEFPAVVKNGNSFIDSSPKFANLKGDYACTNEYYILDFSATDADGDSLSYALIAPIKGFTTKTNPAPYTSDPGPYPTVDFSPGISATNMIPGPVAININPRTGSVRGIASTAGLYVFAVACSEYRNGQKIGEIRRDYVFYVKGDCQHYTSPLIGLKNGNTNYTHQTDTLILQDTKVDMLHLFSVDSSNNDLTIQLIPENFPASNIRFSGLSGHVNSISDTVSTLIQWYDCGIHALPFYKLYAVVSKPACPIPRYDTLEILFKINPPMNTSPNVYTLLLHDSVSIYKDELLNFDVFATDPDVGDQITLSRLTGIGFKGGNFTDTTGPSPIQSAFNWTPQCQDIKNSPHAIYFTAQDNSCYRQHIDTLIVHVTSLQHNVDLSALQFYNLATPNGDHRNDGLIIPILPQDNCDEQFNSIEAYNRYGARVYYSTERVNEIPIDHLSDGVYYYTVTYSNTSYKGWFQVVR